MAGGGGDPRDVTCDVINVDESWWRGLLAFQVRLNSRIRFKFLNIFCSFSLKLGESWWRGLLAFQVRLNLRIYILFLVFLFIFFVFFCISLSFF